MKKYLYLLIVFIFLPNLLSLPIFNDSGAYAYMGTLYFDGMLPYVDGWDHKGISLYLINAMGYLLGFKSLYGIRLLELILMVVSFTKLFNEIREKYSEKIAFVASAFGLLTLRYFFDGGNMTEEYACYFAIICVALLMKEKTRPMHYMIIGFLFLITFTIRANLIGFWISLFFYLVAQLFQQKTKTVLFQFLHMFFGFLVAATALAIYFFTTNSFQDFYEAAFSYNFAYAKNSLTSIILSSISIMRQYELSILLVAALLVVLLRIKNKKSGLLEGLLITWIPIEIYLSNLSGKGFAHYYMTWVPLIIVSVAVLANYFGKEIQQKEKKYVALAVVFFLCFQIPLLMLSIDYKKLIQGNKDPKIEIAKHINQNYDTEQLLVWGNGIQLYSLTGKRAPVPYFYQTFLKVENQYSEQYASDLLNKFKKNLPNLVVDAKTKSMLSLDSSNKDKVSPSMIKCTQELVDFINNKYELKEQKYGMDFYVLKDE